MPSYSYVLLMIYFFVTVTILSVFNITFRHTSVKYFQQNTLHMTFFIKISYTILPTDSYPS